MRPTRLALVVFACLSFATLATAQMAPVMPTNPPSQPVHAMAPAPMDHPALQATELDQDALERRRLEKENRQMRAENDRLKTENAELSGRVDNFSKLGGSEVRAYCADGQTSRNTAGAESDCTRSGYQCEPVSGLCRTSCQTTDMCAAGSVCDTGIQQCVVPGGGD